MSDEQNTGGNAPQDWFEPGDPVSDMTPDQALKEIKSIERNKNFAGKGGTMLESDRQAMLSRRDELYRAAYPETANEPYDSMRDTLQAQGIDEQFLENEQERFEDRDEKESRRKSMDSLISHFGGEDPAKQAIVQARGLLNRFAGPEDLVFLEDSGLGDDPELIQKLAEIARIFERGGKK